MPQFKFNDAELVQVAQAIMKYNTSNTRDVTSLTDYMQYLARKEYSPRMGYVSTIGFVLSYYHYPDNSNPNIIGVKASVCASIL